MYPCHITVVRKGKEEIPDKAKELWGKYEGEIVDFKYNPTIIYKDSYYFIDVNGNTDIL